MVYGQFYQKYKETEGTIKINVGGLKNTVAENVILKFPSTRLGKLLICDSVEAILELCDDYDADEEEYYFDRNPSLFAYVLNFYYTGKLHVMEELCAFYFSEEIEYWGISDLCVHSCCSYKYHECRANAVERDTDSLSDTFSIVALESIPTIHKDMEKFSSMWLGKHRKRLWLFLENPGYSFTSQVFAITSILVVLTSIVAMCFHSMPKYQLKEPQDPGLLTVETICIAFFTIEYLLRLVTAPSLRNFFINSLNAIDLISVLPFYSTLIVERIDENNFSLQNISRVVQVLRLMRMFRILKLARHSNGLKSLGATIRHSYDEVSLLIVFLAVGIAIFGSLIYSSEKEEEESGIVSIPVGWWWAAISMTTVGYGDTCPVTVTGKVIGCFCILFGLLMMALPVTVIFNRFTKYYRREKAINVALHNQEFKKLAAGLPYVNIRDIYVKKMRSTCIANTLSQAATVYSEKDSADSLKDSCDTNPLSPNDLNVNKFNF
ncbi:potassium voltage-gated channel subfamily S member 3-like [Latimeria chalumnae]|uniref:BTB domain-containing protein n=1 Tax=Latimeria chalumnae TaxID=7897 RepID=H3B9G6_LATCH|nr:PREDICTED: potassium voltage-gated channel subfamily S member 3-like [Latimeria chalumnae]|eukprot:XP_005992871.1 PREDICTED: potassium voltage-gated channel subfamily S member 3-like [Latimeria chalumnae]